MKRGDIVHLGRHRLMCGDASDATDVKGLIANDLPTVIFTSPPYLEQRQYGTSVPCWTTLMTGALADVPQRGDTQIIVNLGLVHRQSEWIEYWQDWLCNMRAHGWRKFGWYVWDKKDALPGNRNGRLAPSFEFLFHLNKKPRDAHKIIPCKFAGVVSRKTYPDFTAGSWAKAATTITQSHKIMDATLRFAPEKSRRGILDHPAKFPKVLPSLIMQSWSDENDSVYDPFSGAGTTLIAAEETGRSALLMEIHPPYCDMTIERYHKHIEKTNAPSKPKRKVVT